MPIPNVPPVQYPVKPDPEATRAPDPRIAELEAEVARAILSAAPARLEIEFLPIDAPFIARAVIPVSYNAGYNQAIEDAAETADEWGNFNTVRKIRALAKP